MPKRSPKLYLDDIKLALKNIQQYTRRFDYLDFIHDQKTIDAVVRNFEIIGEAAGRLPKNFTNKYSNIPWGKMVGMRNKAIHEYFGMDLGIVWKTIEDDIPKLSKQLARVNS